MKRLSREVVADFVRNGLVNDLLVKKYREDADLRVELRIDEDDIDDFIVALLQRIGVDPNSVDTAAFDGQVHTPHDMVEFVIWCYQKGIDKIQSDNNPLDPEEK